MTASAEVLERERRWSRPVSLATFALVALFIASVAVLSSVGGGGEAEGLREVHAHGSTVTASSILQAGAFALLLAPLLYLYRAAQARDPRMRSQFLPLAVVAPLALAVASVLSGIAANEAATEFAAGNAKSTLSRSAASRECDSEKREEGEKFKEEFGAGAAATSRCSATKIADDEAENAISEASLRTPSGVLQLAGTLGVAFVLAYASFYAMRTGLLSRFWGSLGIALGVASVLGLFVFALLWLLYFAFLVAGWVPGGRPPAWAAGEAVPWPTPGQRAAAEIAADEDEEASAAESEDAGEVGGEGQGETSGEAEGEGTSPATPPEGQPPRKRKQRE